GRSSLDTSAITGESIPEEVAPGDEVPAGAINSAGVLEVETTAAGTDNSLTTLVDLVEQAQAEKGDRARIADRIAQPLGRVSYMRNQTRIAASTTPARYVTASLS